MYSYPAGSGLPATTAAGIQWNKPLETPVSTPPVQSKINLTRFEELRRDRAARVAANENDATTKLTRFEELQRDRAARVEANGCDTSAWRRTGVTHCEAKDLTAAAMANIFNGDTVEHRDIHEHTGLPSTLYGRVIGATVYAGAAPGSQDENRLIMQSSDGLTRLVEVNHLRQFGATSELPQTNHSNTQLWVPPSSATPQDQKLVVAQTHLTMVEHYSDMLVAAMKRREEVTDQWSFECDPVTGAVMCAASMPHLVADTESEAGHRNRLPSSLTDEEDRPDSPVEALVEPNDRCSATALTGHKKATRRPDWAL